MDGRQMKVRKLSIAACGFFLLQAFAAAQAPTDTASLLQPQPLFKPMTQGERFQHYVKSTFSVESILRSAAGAGIHQATDTPHEWGQGAEGYGRRFGDSFAQQIMRQTLVYGASDLLHEDNRYIPSGESGAGARVKYAVASTFLARKDNGTRRFSYSRIGGTLAVAFISREWQPPSENKPRNAAASFGTTLGTEVGFNIAREFLPEVFRPH
jgi:hypothetical protein